MTLFLEDPDRWNKVYEDASAKQQYDLLIEAIEQLPTNLDEGDQEDFLDLLIDFQSELRVNNLLDLAFNLINKLKQFQPQIFQAEFSFFDSLLYPYHLFHHELEPLKEPIERLIAYPFADEGHLFLTLDYLKYYNATDLAVECSRSIYDSARELEEFEDLDISELAVIVLDNLMEQAHQQLVQGETVDWRKFQTDITPYIFSDLQEWMEDVRCDLATEIEGDSEFFAEFKRDFLTVIRRLFCAFAQYMAEHKQVSFIASRGIWEELLQFLDRPGVSHKRLSHPDKYFSMTLKSLAAFISQKMNLLSLNYLRGAALAWGLPYVYDFLLSKQIISAKTHQQAIEAATAVKQEIIKGFSNSLWEYDFVHRWLPPDSIAEETFITETQQFVDSIQQVTPLSEEMGIYKALEKRINEYANQVGISLKELEDADDLDDSADQEHMMEDLKRIRNIMYEDRKSYQDDFESIKRHKPQKSPLQIAAGLEEKKSKSTSKKKKRGFG
ncbi:MAG: hypothetical protein QNJ46_18135 [Leptolyngbyaceae cyanobacterium MO_188.B28]|nr:hypothetical protein [Leptolyngbyaceae cyanobacterium MO_188.B28]